MSKSRSHALSLLLAFLGLVVARLAATPVEVGHPLDQTWRLHSLAEAAGLSKANILGIDFERTGPPGRVGTAWIATSAGLHEFDGYSWKRHGKAQGLPSDFVRAVLVARNGDLWIGTDRGAGVYDGRTFRTLGSETGLAGPNVRRIVEDATGTLWFCSDSWPDTSARGGLASFRDGRWTAYRSSEGLPDEYVVNFLRDSAGNEFAVTLAGVARRKGDRWHTVLEPPRGREMSFSSACLGEVPGLGVVLSNGDDLLFREASGWRAVHGEMRHRYGICTTSDGHLFAGGITPSGHGIVVEWSTNTWEPRSASYQLPNGYTEDIREAPDGSLWVIGFGTLIRWERRSSEFNEYEDVPPPHVTDSEGHVWFAADPGSGRSRRPLRLDAQESWERLDAEVDSLAASADGRQVWGWADAEVVRFTGNRIERLGPSRTGFTNIATLGIDGEGRCWIAGRLPSGRTGVASHVDGSWVVRQPQELAGLEVWRIPAAHDADGIWIGADRGPGTAASIVRISDRLVDVRPLPTERFSRFHVQVLADRRGDLWVYGDAGLHRWPKGAAGWTAVTNLPARKVANVVERGDEIWFGCVEDTGGDSALVRFRDGLWTTFLAASNGRLHLEFDGTITAGGFGRFWRIPNTADAFPIQVSLPVPERVVGVVKGRDGSYWMNRGGGVARYLADRVPPETRLGGPARIFRGDPFEAEATGIERFTPGPVVDDHLYSWRLDGGPWSRPSPPRSHVLPTADLAVGAHRLEARCHNGIEEVDPTPAVLDFQVGLRPLQERRWFLPLIGFVVAGVSVLALAAFRARRELSDLVGTLERRVAERTSDLEMELQRRARVERELRFHEALLRETGEIANVGGWTFDVASGEGFWTAEVARMHGVATSGSASRSRVLDFYSGEDRRRFEEAVQRACEQGQPYDLELQLVTPKGRLRWIRTLGRPVREDDRIVRIFGSFQDVSARKAAEESVRDRLRLQTRLATVAASVPGALFSFVLRPDGRAAVPDASPKLEDVFGLDPSALERSVSAALRRIHPEDRRRVLASVDAAVREVRPWYDVFRVRHPSKGVVWIEGNAHPAEGGTHGSIWHGFLLDITDRHHLEARRNTEHAVVGVLASADAIDAATPALLRVLCESEGWSHGELWIMDEAEGVLTCRALWNRGGSRLGRFVQATRSLRMRSGEDLIGRVHRTGTPIHETSIPTCPGFLRATEAAEAGISSGIAFPIRIGERITGVLAFFGRQSTPPDPSLLDMLHNIGEQVGQFLSRKAVEEQLRRFTALSPATLYALRRAGDRFVCHWTSENVATLTGFTAEEAVREGWWLGGLHDDDRARVLEASAAHDATGRRILEYRFRRKDGSWLWIRDEQRIVSQGDGPEEVVGAWTDVTERRELEGRLRQVQKMEAIGQLSGGIAHDFNNILGSIVGNAQLGSEEAAHVPEAASHFAEILRAARRAANLVQQILTFARQDSHEKRRIRLRPVLEETARLLRATLPAGIDLVVHVAPDVPAVLADDTQVQQILLNLGTNAWHALPRGGRITLELDRRAIDEAAARSHPDLKPGDYARLRVRDNGTGMDTATLERIFEPFFTTKPPGQGTGLGLSVVHGIVRSHGGAVLVESAPGVGTTFDILLPAVAGEDALAAAGSSGPAVGHGQRILVVDDEAPLLRITTKVLERLGYRVVPCGSPEEGSRHFAEDPAAFDLLLCDLNMPGRSGIDLAREFLARRPDLPVILASGMVSEELRTEALRLGIREILRKPMSVEELGEALARCLRPPG